MKKLNTIQYVNDGSDQPILPPASASLPPPPRIFLTVRQTAERFPIFTEAAIRSLIFQAKAEAKLEGARSIGFSNVIFRVPGQRKVLISEQHLIDWISSGQVKQ